MSDWLLLHGFTGTPEAFATLEFARERAVIPVLAGHGASGVVLPVSFAAEVKRIHSYLADAGGHPVHLLGYSLGARLALGLLTHEPSVFASATLVGVHPGLATEQERRARREQDEAWAQVLETEGLEAFVDRWEAEPLFSSQRRLPEPLQRAQREARLSHTASGLAHALRALGLGSMPDFRDQLSRLDLPVTLVVGERDEKFRRLAAFMLPLLPRARLEIAPRVGHNVVLEAPGFVNQRMREVACS